MSQPILKIALDNDQKGVLIVYSLYTNQLKHKYLQYSAPSALIFYLNKKGIFSSNPNELLVYDYLGSGKYTYKAK